MKINVKEIFTPSNLISIFRLLMAIPFWILFDYYSEPNINLIILSLCLFAAFTDILDGFLARKLNQVTEFGKIIDPLADKVAMAIVVIRLFMAGEISTFFFILLIARDSLIFLGGIFVSKKINKVLPSNILGKITVLVIGLFVILTLAQINREGIFYILVYYLSITLMLASLAAYYIRATEFLKRKDESV